jgi:hypothetical protein
MRTENSKERRGADELDFPNTFLACVVRQSQGGGKCGHSRARIDVFTKRNHSHNPRCTINTTKDANGREQRLALLKLDLLCAISPVDFRLGVGARIVDLGGPSGDTTCERSCPIYTLALPSGKHAMGKGSPFARSFMDAFVACLDLKGLLV